jgi:hypothetical protein
LCAKCKNELAVFRERERKREGERKERERRGKE